MRCDLCSQPGANINAHQSCVMRLAEHSSRLADTDENAKRVARTLMLAMNSQIGEPSHHYLNAASAVLAALRGEP